MDLNELDNKQMVLLGMFVSFVIAIATSIVTVALLQSSPQTVTQTITRVVEKTIETVTPNATDTPVVAVATKPEPIVLSSGATQTDDDRAVAAAATGGDSVLQVRSANGKELLGIGIALRSDGIIAISSAIAPKDGGSVTITNGSHTYTATLLSGPVVDRVALLSAKIEKGDKLTPIVPLGNASIKAGMSVVAVGGSDGQSIFRSTISRLIWGEIGSTTPATLRAVDLSPKLPAENDGALVLGLDGKSVGMALFDPELDRFVVVPSGYLLGRLASAEKAAQSSGTASTTATSTAR